MAENTPTIRLEDNENKKNEYNGLSSNEARRQFVAQEFLSGTFSDKSHIDFFLEQYSKGNILIPDDQKQKIAELAMGIEGYPGLADISKNMVDTIVKNSGQKTSVSYYGGAEAISDPNFLKTEKNDYGLEAAIASIDSSAVKDDFDSLIIEARKQASKNKIHGSGGVTEYGAVKDKLNQTQLKWYQLRRRIKLADAKRAVDPAHWATKKVNASWFGSRAYYGARDYLANRNRDVVKNARKRLDKTIELQQKAKSSKWLSKSFGTKLKSNIQLAWRKVTFRGEGFLTNRIVKHANTFELAAVTREMSQRMAGLGNGLTKAQQRGIDVQHKIMSNLIEKSATRAAALGEKHDAYCRALDEGKAKTISPAAQKFNDNLKKQATELESQHLEALKKHPLYKALDAAGLELPDNAKTKITGEMLLNSILEGKSNDEKKEIKTKLGLTEDVKKVTEEKNETDEIIFDENDTRQEASKVTRLQNNDKDIAWKDPETHGNIEVQYNDDKSAYKMNLEEGQEPSAEQLKEFAHYLKEQGLTNVQIDSTWGPEKNKEFLDALKEAGIENIANEKDILEAAEKAAAERENKKDDKAEEITDDHTSGDKPKDEIEADDKKKDQPEETLDNDGKPVVDKPQPEEAKKMDIETVMQSVMNNDKLTAEQKLEQMAVIHDIQEGKVVDKEKMKMFDIKTPEGGYLSEVNVANELRTNIINETGGKAYEYASKEEQFADSEELGRITKELNISTPVKTDENEQELVNFSKVKRAVENKEKPEDGEKLNPREQKLKDYLTALEENKELSPEKKAQKRDRAVQLAFRNNQDIKARREQQPTRKTTLDKAHVADKGNTK